MRYIVTFFISLLFFSAFAEGDSQEPFPDKCTPYAINGQSVMQFDFKDPKLVLVHNLSSKTIWMIHSSDRGVEAGWNSSIASHNWSALAVNSKPFKLSCVESSPGHEQQVDCGDVLALCTWDDAKMPKSVSGSTVWAGEDLGLKVLLTHIGQRGFKL